MQDLYEPTSAEQAKRDILRSQFAAQIEANGRPQSVRTDAQPIAPSTGQTTAHQQRSDALTVQFLIDAVDPGDADALSRLQLRQKLAQQITQNGRR